MQGEKWPVDPLKCSGHVYQCWSGQLRASFVMVRWLVSADMRAKSTLGPTVIGSTDSMLKRPSWDSTDGSVGQGDIKGFQQSPCYHADFGSSHPAAKLFPPRRRRAGHFRWARLVPALLFGVPGTHQRSSVCDLNICMLCQEWIQLCRIMLSAIGPGVVPRTWILLRTYSISHRQLAC